MFWGLIMEPNKRYTQTVEKPFHISQAAMDTSTGDSEICQVMVVVDGKNFLVCTLQKNKTIQVPLDLYFKTGNVISFLTNGKCNVHLTGYLDPEFDEEESDGEEEEDGEEAPALVPAKNKRKLDTSIETATKKLKQDTKKLLKPAAPQDSDESEEEEEDDSSDEDGADDLQKLLEGDVDSDENDDSFRPNSTGADSDEDSDEEEEEEEDEAESKSEQETEADTSKEETPTKLSKAARRRQKRKQQQQQQQQEQPQTNGVEKKKAKKEQQPEQKQKQKPAAEAKPVTPEKREKKNVVGGVQIEDTKVGGGPVAKAGKVVMVYYEGRLKQNNKMFDSCNKGPGFKFRLGSKEVIAGWDAGIAGMRVGGKRKIICPPGMAYGVKGSPPVIPPNSTLVFEVELKNIK